MKHIQLECKTRGFGYGDILEVGAKKDIPLNEAEALVESGMAKEYKAPVTGGVDAKRVTELEGANGLLTAKVAELEGANGILTAKVAEVEGANGLLTAKVAELETIIAAINGGKDNGKENTAQK